MRTLSFLLFVFLISCKQSNQQESPAIQNQLASPKLDFEEASRLISLPLHCIDKEYPNKLGQTIGGDQDLQSPKVLHPAFYGCFDWHSSVHGHWSLVALLKQFPTLENADQAKQRLLTSISKENIEKSIRNIPNIKVTDVNHFSAFDIAKFKKIVFTENSIKELEKGYI